MYCNDKLSFQLHLHTQPGIEFMLRRLCHCESNLFAYLVFTCVTYISCFLTACVCSAFFHNAGASTSPLFTYLDHALNPANRHGKNRATVYTSEHRHIYPAHSVLRKRLQ